MLYRDQVCNSVEIYRAAHLVDTFACTLETVHMPRGPRVQRGDGRRDAYSSAHHDDAITRLDVLLQSGDEAVFIERIVLDGLRSPSAGNPSVAPFSFAGDRYSRVAHACTR
jgi:hypothetical protein